MPEPLDGVYVLELAGIGPAPMACMLLADLGAQVLRIERPDGPRRCRGPRPSRSITPGRKLSTALLAWGIAAAEQASPAAAGVLDMAGPVASTQL